MDIYDGGLLQGLRSIRGDHMATELREPQHTLLQSAILHLGPGLLITLFYVLTAPAIVQYGFPPLAALLLAILYVALPIELGELVRQGYRRNGRHSLNGIDLCL